MERAWGWTAKTDEHSHLTPRHPGRDELRVHWLTMAIMEDPTCESAAPHTPDTASFGADGAYLCVLASGSAGNCSVLALCRGGMTRLCLIDLGLSPRRTFRMMAELEGPGGSRAALRPDMIDECLVTHLDSDHLHTGWRRQTPGHVRVRMHDRHARAAGMKGWLKESWKVTPFEDDFAIEDEVRVRPLLMSHDELGVAAYRIELAPAYGGGSLGFATDLGHVHSGLVDHFGASEVRGAAAVDVLAIESNYCPAMQHASTRPEVLKHRIMGGHGHLSNQECVSAVMQIEPREHVVLLHLSRQCNRPEVVAALHSGADYALTISTQSAPTRWVKIGSGGARPLPRREQAQLVVRPRTLWTMNEEPAGSTHA